MTFREEDLLPYQKIDFDKTPEYLKTTFMQWTMLEPYLHEYGGFDKGIHLDKLSNMSLLDRNPSSGGFDDFPYAPADFSAAFGQAVKENEHEDARVAARQAELKQMVGMLFKPNNERIREKVEMLITEELKEEKVPERLWIAANMRSKAICLADFRLREKYGHMPKPDDYDNNPTKYTFRVYLNRVVGGQGLNMDVTSLYFPYNTPFHQFEKILQAETQLCCIRPEVSQSLGSSEPTSTSSASTPAGPLTTTSTLTLSASSSEAHAASASEAFTYSEFGSTWVKIAPPPSRVEKGYNIKDGSWRCKIGAKQATTANKGNVMVSNEKSYLTLVSKIQDYNRMYPNNEHFMIIMHSRERTIWEKSMQDKEIYERELRQRSKTLAAEAAAAGVVDEDEDTSGETYFEWLCRTKKV